MFIPDNETAVDYLNCEAISRTVVTLLKQNRARALTVGVHGDWGAGKSSILKMVELGLSKDKNVACLWFNGWAFEGFDDAKTVLIEATITELYRQRSTVGKVKELSRKLLKRVDWLKVAKRGSGLAINALTGLPSPDQIESVVGMLKNAAAGVTSVNAEDLKSTLEEAATYLKPAEEGNNVPDVIHDFREDFKALLEEAKIDQLVVLIDDLDRCLPSTAIETLEAIRLFLFVPKTAFVIGADEAMIEYAVRQHFPDLPIASGPLPYARNYLEKLIQLPLRIPPLGTQETRCYVTLLLVQSIVGEDHQGFSALLQKGKEAMSKPWLGASLTQQDVQAVDKGRLDELNAAFLLAQQIGPILAEGTKGNPRQIKRFLNTLLVRQVIAEARGFADLITQPIMAKLMLAERFHPSFYDHLAEKAMKSTEGKVADLDYLEGALKAQTEGGKSKAKAEAKDTDVSQTTAKWLDDERLKDWLKIEPPLAGTDLRPYVFVARDKRMIAGAIEAGGLDRLVAALCGTQLEIRSVEPELKVLSPGDAQAVFDALRERILAAGTFNTPPSGFDGIAILAKHHPRYQRELLTFIASLDPKSLGIWILKGWNEVITDATAKQQLVELVGKWGKQDDNALLKKTAPSVLSALKEGRR